jgi:hypothetical protein
MDTGNFAVLAFYQNLFLLSAKVGFHKTFQLSAFHVFLTSKWLAGFNWFLLCQATAPIRGVDDN